MRWNDKIRNSVVMLSLLIITISVVLKIVYGGNEKHFSFDFSNFRNKVLLNGNVSEGGKTCNRASIGKESDSIAKNLPTACKTGIRASSSAGIKSFKKNTPDFVAEKVSEFRSQISLGQKMFAALDAGNYELVKEIVVKHPELANFTNEEGTPIFVNVVKSNRKELMELFLSLGADPNGKDKIGNRALCYVMTFNNIETVKLLLDNGAQINYKVAELEDSDGCYNDGIGPPLLLAVNRNKNVDMAKLLISRGADINVKDCHGRTAIFYAVDYNYTELAHILLDMGAEVNIRDCDGKTPIFNVRNPELAKSLVIKGADVNVRDCVNDTAFSYAVRYGRYDIARFLIEKGAEVNTTNKLGMTPLHYVCNFRLAQYLLDHGLDVNAKNYNGNTPLLFLLNRCYYEPEESDPYIEKLVLLYLSRGADINEINDEKLTPLHIAVFRGKTRLIKFLLSRGADMRAADYTDRTPIQYAAKMCNRRALLVFIQAYLSRNRIFYLVVLLVLLSGLVYAFKNYFLKKEAIKDESAYSQEH